MAAPASQQDHPITPEALEEALEVGRAARELIRLPAYVTALSGLEAFHVSAMVGAPEGPAGADARDHHHRMLHALRELATEFTARAQAATDIEAQLDVAAEDADDEEP